jgi:hypothetical protein
MSNPLCIVALSIRLKYIYLELVKVGICETLETRSRRHKVVFKVVHLICEDEWTPTNEEYMSVRNP